MLVVSCPCALSLATPVAYTIATGSVRKLGVLIASGAFLEKLAQVNVVVLDKTGTLTEGAMNLEEVHLLNGRLSREDAIALAAGLEQGSLHPVAVTLRNLAGEHIAVTDAVNVPGSGVSGTMAGEHWRFGRPDWACDVVQGTFDEPADSGNRVLLARASTPVA